MLKLITTEPSQLSVESIVAEHKQAHKTKTQRHFSGIALVIVAVGLISTVAAVGVNSKREDIYGASEQIAFEQAAHKSRIKYLQQLIKRITVVDDQIITCTVYGDSAEKSSHDADEARLSGTTTEQATKDAKKFKTSLGYAENQLKALQREGEHVKAVDPSAADVVNWEIYGYPSDGAWVDF